MTRDDREPTEAEARWSGVPRSIGGAAEAVLGARGEPRRLQRIFERSPVPAVMFDDQRRPVEANRPARLWFRSSLEEMRRHAMGDLTPPDRLGVTERAWARLLETGFVAGRYEGAKPDGSPIDVVYCALAEVLPGLHVIVFAPGAWPEGELGEIVEDGLRPSASLTPREIEVIALAAEGAGIPELSEELALSPDTVRSHLKHIYAKLGVHNRTAAVTRAIRLGLIDA
jgi:DNA-binding CsgD family transcriptional regulator